VTRYPVYGLCERIWDLRDNVSADDASYIALAESLNCHFLDLTAQPARLTPLVAADDQPGDVPPDR
jgi:hypothetical protein